MNILITGITGMIGSHFANACREKGWNTFGIARGSAESRLNAVPDPGIIRCDIMDRDALEDAFLRTMPDIVIHLAAQAFNSLSWAMEELTSHVNYQGTINVMRCCRRIVPKAKVLIACSSAEYGDVDLEECPITEDRMLCPVTPYGVSKVSTENIGYQYHVNYGIQVYLPRLFIHVGTGHPPVTAIQNFARQLALISKGLLDPVVKVGPLETARDFIDVRDGVAGMMLMLEKGQPGDPTNICTGKAFKISEILDLLIKISGQKVQIVSDPSLHRPSDERLLLGNNTKLKNLGWRQQYSMEETLKAVYEDWLMRI